MSRESRLRHVLAALTFAALIAYWAGSDFFGEDRLVYGSNWPVTMRGGAYGDYLSVVLEYYRPKGREFLEKLLYGNAMKCYRLPETTR